MVVIYIILCDVLGHIGNIIRMADITKQQYTMYSLTSRSHVDIKTPLNIDKSKIINDILWCNLK